MVETLKFNIYGEFKRCLCQGPDLEIIKDIGANGANYKVMEFGGPAIRISRLTTGLSFCNMAVKPAPERAYRSRTRRLWII